MPGKARKEAASKRQQRAAAIAVHHPEQLHVSNRNLLDMDQADLRSIASTPRRGLPATAPKPGRKGRKKG